MDLEYYQFHLLLLDFLCFQSQWHKLFDVLQKISQNYQNYTSYAGQMEPAVMPSSFLPNAKNRDYLFIVFFQPQLKILLNK